MADPWAMAKVGAEFSHQSALFAWAAMAQSMGVVAASHPESYTTPGEAKKWALHHPQAYPELKWLHAIKNQGHGDRIRGSRSKAEGVRTGVFDTFLPVPMRYLSSHCSFYVPDTSPLFIDGYAGLYIELKTPDRKTHKNGGASDKQLEFQADMRAMGYAAEVCHGWEAARDCLLTYLGHTT